MSIRPAISVPLPWLTVLVGRIFEKRGGLTQSGRRGSLLPRSLRVTREGWWFLAVLFFIGLAAINTGNNLLYLVVATLLSLIIISGIMSEVTLKGVKVRRRVPRHVYKGEPSAVKYFIENKKTRLASISFRLEEVRADGVCSEPAYIVRLAPRHREQINARYVFKRRGRFTLTAIKVSTRFPFGLFCKGKEESVEAEVTVYPRPKSVRVPAAPPPVRSTGQRSSRRKGDGTQLHNLRDYTFQYDSRFIYWRSAASGGGLKVKEFDAESERRVLINFENYSSPGAEDLFEDMVDEVSGVVSHFIERGYHVGLKTLSENIAPGPGKNQFYRLQNVLALISPAGEGGGRKGRVPVRGAVTGAPRYRIIYL